MVKTDLHCTNLDWLLCSNHKCEHQYKGKCIACVPHYAGQAVVWCSKFTAKEPDDMPIRYQLVEGVC